MKILFIGTVEFSAKTLIKLIELKANVVGLITKEASIFNADFADMSNIATSNKIPFLKTVDVNSVETLSWVKKLQPDIIFCFGWSNLIKKELLHIPRKGVLGFHPAFLPENRGRHPIVWALALGLKQTASTFFFMNEGADSGPILNQSIISISNQDDAASLYKKIINEALKQIELFLPSLSTNTYTLSIQDDSKANYWRKRGREDGKIDWRMTNDAIYNLVRALNKPYIGAHLEYKGKDIKVWKVKKVIHKTSNIEPGKIIKSDGQSIVIKCYAGAIEIIEHEFEKLPTAGEYL